MWLLTNATCVRQKSILIGDPTKAKQKLGWQPSVTFEQLVQLMVEADLKALGLIPLNGHVAQPTLDQATIRQTVGGSTSF